MKRIILLSIIIINSLVIHSQNVLTIDDAINIALKNNFDIWIARNDADAAKLNNTLGNAGMLPGVSITGSDNYAVKIEGLFTHYPRSLHGSTTVWTTCWYIGS